MKFVLTLSVVVMLSSMIAFAADQHNQVVDRGYECFNLEIAQAQLAQARLGHNWRAVMKARTSVANREKLCNIVPQS